MSGNEETMEGLAAQTAVIAVGEMRELGQVQDARAS